MELEHILDSPIYSKECVHTVRSLGLRRQTIDPLEMATRYVHSKGLPIVSYENAASRILIGMDNSFLTQGLKTFEAQENEPAASKTRLNWVVYG